MGRATSKLSDSFLRTAKHSGKTTRADTHSDGGGLYFLVSTAGGKSWQFNYAHAGKQKTLRLGAYPALSAAQARKARDDARIVDYWDALRRIDEMAVCTDEHGGLLLTTPGMTNDAVEVWLEFYNATEARQAVGNDMDALRPFASRAGELAARVAAVYALWRCCGMDGATPGKTVINVTDMRQAVSLVSYSLDEWRRQGDSAILSATERDARDLLTWMHRKELENVTRSHIAQHGPNALRKMTDRRNAAIDELKRRRWLIEKGGGLAIVKKSERQPATAIPANSANSDNRYQDESSKSSGNSSSNGSQLFFAPAMPELKPAFVVDVDASIKNLLAQFEASNATEMRARANG